MGKAESFGPKLHSGQLLRPITFMSIPLGKISYGTILIGKNLSLNNLALANHYGAPLTQGNFLVSSETDPSENDQYEWAQIGLSKFRLSKVMIFFSK